MTPETQSDNHGEVRGRWTGLSRHGRRAFLAAGIGWGLDGFDWTMYGFALPAIVATLGISTAQAGYAATASLASSAIGGIGGGVLADRFGRTRVLTFVILGYAITTALTATSQDLIQLTTWRTLQGLAFGAEWAVGAALLSEYAHSATRGRLMGMLQSCYAIGWAVSTAAFLLVFTFAPANLAWRYLFLIGVLPALAALYVRLHTRDRVAVQPTTRRWAALPELFTRQRLRTTILATLVGIAVQGIYYAIFIFLPTFLENVRHLGVIGTATYTWLAIVGSFVGYVVAGYIHDAIGRRPTFSLFFVGGAAAIAAFVTVPLSGLGVGLLVTFFLGFFASGQAAGLGSYLAELYPTKMRATGQGFSYNVGRGVAGASPAAVGAATATIGLGSGILIVGAVAAAIGLATIWLLPETRGNTIITTDEETPVPAETASPQP
jgi:MFS family permease